ncbi:MAG: metal ABC transporter permease [Acidimicrobiales bacterium]
MEAAVFAPGFFSSGPVHVALSVGALVAVVSAVVGTFTVMRGQSFAGHALADIGSTGGAGAYLVGVPLLWGFVAVNIVAAALMGVIGINRPRGRDLATGIVLGAALGVSALLLYITTTTSSTGSATFSVLFGSLFVVSPAIVPVVGALSAVALVAVALLYRPLLLSTLSNDLAAARGVPTGLVSATYLIALALAVSLSAVSIGAILSTALLIGPAATALRLTRRVGSAMLLAAAIGVTATWLGILLAYDSHNWPPDHRGWPVSFFVVAVVMVMYLLSTLVGRSRRTATAPEA